MMNKTPEKLKYSKNLPKLHPEAKLDKSGIKKSHESIYELPDFSISSKPLNKIINEDLHHINEYGDSILSDYKQSMFNKEKRHHSVKKFSRVLSREQNHEPAKESSKELDDFDFLLQNPLRVDKAIAALVNLKDQIIKKDINRIQSTVVSSYLVDRINDFCTKCLKVIRKQQDSKETLFSCKNVTITPFS